MNEKDISALGKKTVLVSAVSCAVMALFLFIPAGTLFYWQAWLYLAVLFLGGAWSCLYLLKHDPALLARRMGVNPFAEPTVEQKVIQGVNSVLAPATYGLSAWDHGRNAAGAGAGAVPDAVALAANALVLLSLGIIFMAARANSYASALVAVESGQKVADTGPYALVRHPMYVGAILYFAATPPALGSLWGLVPAALICANVAARLKYEEAYLSANLQGYGEYRRKVRYRLLPGVW